MQPVLASHAADLLGDPGTLDLMPKRLRDLELTAHQDIFLGLWSFPICYGLLWDNGLEGALAPEQQGLSGKVLSEVGVPSG